MTKMTKMTTGMSRLNADEWYVHEWTCLGSMQAFAKLQVPNHSAFIEGPWNPVFMIKHQSPNVMKYNQTHNWKVQICVQLSSSDI